jgi:DNA-binding transcriptional ArsR family regulator
MRACAYGLMRNLSDEQIALVAGRSRALGDATRVRILEALSRGEQSVGQLGDGLGSPQSTISKHLQVLFHAGLVQRRRAASTVFYTVASETLAAWVRFLGTRQLPGTKPAANPRIESERARQKTKSPQRSPA